MHRLTPLALCALVLVAPSARADTYNWTAGNGSWLTPGNWSSVNGGVPTASDDAVIGFLSAAQYAVTVDGTATAQSLTVTQGEATVSVVSGGSLTIGGAFSLNPGKFSQSGGTVTVNGPMTAPTSKVTLSGGTLGGTGDIAIGGTFTWLPSSAGTVIGGSGTVTLTNPSLDLTGTGSGTRQLTGTRTMVVDADATWGGGQISVTSPAAFRVNPGRTLTLTGNGNFAFGSGTLDVSGTLRIAQTTPANGSVGLNLGGTTGLIKVPGTIEVRQGTLFIDSTAHFDPATYSSGTITGGTWRVQNAPGQNAAISLGGSFPVSAIGPNATVELNGATSYFDAVAHGLLRVDGTFRVLGGNFFPKDSTGFVVPLNGLTVNGTVQVGAGSTINPLVNVQSGGVVLGAGTIGTTSTVFSGGTVRPGDPGTAGTLTVTGLKVQTGSKLNIVGGSAANSKLQLTSTSLAPVAAGDTISIVLTNDGTLDLSGNTTYTWTVVQNPSGVAFPGGVFTIGTPSNFTFASPPTLLFTGTNGNVAQVQFTPVPEPVGLLAAAAGLAVLVRRRRK